MFQGKYLIYLTLLLFLYTGLPDRQVHAQFVDVAGTSGITTPHAGQLTSFDMGLGTGAAWFDYDQDGDLDLYMTMRVGANLLYQNNGGTFTEVAAAAGAQDAARDGAGVVAADFNNDGCKDLFLANSNEDTILQNNCDGTFTDVTVGSGLDASGARRGTSASVGDYDGDGLLDLYVAHHTPIAAYGVPDDAMKDQDYLFHNDGNFVFTDVSDDMLGTSTRENASFIAAWTDFDNDGDLDIYLIRDCGFDGSGDMDLWRNDGGTNGVTDWTFTEVASTVNGDWCQNGMGVAVGDYDRNGYMDLFYTDNGVTGGDAPNRAGTVLLANSATGFTDMTDVAGVSTTNFSWGANFFDYNLDGYLDLFMAAGAVNDASASIDTKLWESDGGTFTFTDVTAAQGVSDTGRGRTGVFGDYDQDGDPDLFYVNYAGDVHLWRNDNGGTNNWLILDLQGVTSNRDGIGARIELISAGGTQYHEVRSGSSLGGGDDTGAYFGLGADATVTTINITWPSGTVQTLSSVGSNQRMTVVEPTPALPDLFSDVSFTAGVDVTHGGATDGDMPVGTGAAWFDYDNDGDKDLYMTNREGANWLFDNDGGVFTDVALTAGVQDAAGTGAGVAAADFDNDGCIDLFLANSHGDVLFQNNCDGTFTNITTGSGLEATEERRGTSASWADYDADGFLDLYVSNHMPSPAATFTGDAEQDYLFRNNSGDGTFTDVSDMLLGADRLGRAFIGGWTDYDNDGDIDLYTIRDCPFGGNSGPMRLYRNDGGTDGATDWTFTQVAESVGADWCQNGMGLAVGDYNRDGWMDFFFTDNGAATTDYPASPNRIGAVLLRNDLGTFTEQTDFAGVDNNLFSWGANFFDFDNDMFQDLYMVAGAMDPLVSMPGMLWENDGDGTFTDVSLSSGGLNDPENTRTSAFSDYDGDGDLDMFLVNYGQQARLFRNDNNNGNNWVALDLEGTTSNRDGIGAKIELTSGGVTQYYETRSGSSLGAGDDTDAFFGLGTNFSISDVTITWPSGVVQVLGSLGINQRHTIVEPGTSSSTLSVAPLSVDFGFVDAGSSSAPALITLTNDGVDPIDVTSVSVSGTDMGDFMHTFAGPVTVGGGATSTFDVTFSPIASSAPLLPEGVLYRVNAGGTLIGDWEEDTDAMPSSYLLPGATSIESDNPDPVLDATVPAGTPVDMFRTMRLDANSPEPYMEWDFPVTAGEQVEVRMYFVEMSRCATANRLFDVEIEGLLALDDFDIYTEAGGQCNVGIMRSFTVTPADDNLDINFPLVNGRPSALAGLEILGSAGAPSTRTAQLNVNHTGANGTLVVDLAGETTGGSTGSATLAVSPESLDFGQVEEGLSSTPMTVTLTNNGASAIDVTAITMTGTDDGDFEHTFTAPVTIGGGATSTVDVTFAPKPPAAGPESLLPEGVLYRINAGGALLGDWEEDTASQPSPYLLAGSAGVESDAPTPTLDASVPVGTPVELFETKRIDADKALPYMEWDLPVTAGAAIDIRLFFVEMSRCAVDSRVFDVTIEGAVVLDDLDVYAEAGGCNVGITRSFTVTPTDANLDINFPLENGKPATLAGIEILESGTVTTSPRSAQMVIDHTGSNPSLTVDLAGLAIITPGSVNNAPVAAFQFQYDEGNPTGNNTFFIDASYDEDGSIVSWDWDLGVLGTSTQQNPIALLDPDLIYPVTLTVTDNAGLTGSVTENIRLADLPYLEQLGIAVVEAENYFVLNPLGDHTWTEHTAIAGFSGAGAMEVSPNIGENSNGINSTMMSYEVEFQTGGTYYVWARVYAPALNDNSLHMGHNGAATAAKMDQTVLGAWEWTNVNTKGNRLSIDLNAEQNTINVWMREDGLIIDKILLTIHESYTPVGEGPEESLRIGLSEGIVGPASPEVLASKADDGLNKGEFQAEAQDLPTEFELGANYPNPFNPTTTIEFSVPEATEVTLEVYDMMGRRVATLVNGQLDAGRYQANWNSRSDAGTPVASGVYIYRIQAGSFQQVRQMVLMK